MGSNVDKFRHEVDQGRGGDKVDFPDPAAAPLGTDDEAGGVPPTTEDVRMAERQEIRPGADSGPSTTDESSRTISGESKEPKGLGVVTLVGLVAVLAVLAIIVFLAV